MQLLAGLGPLGIPELAIILVIVLLVFGVGRLPEVGGAVGKSIREFRKATKDDETPAASSTMTSATPEAPSATMETPTAAAAAPMQAAGQSEETIFCSQCGARNLRSAKFCAECGRSIGASVS